MTLALLGSPAEGFNPMFVVGLARPGDKMQASGNHSAASRARQPGFTPTSASTALRTDLYVILSARQEWVPLHTKNPSCP